MARAAAVLPSVARRRDREAFRRLTGRLSDAEKDALILALALAVPAPVTAEQAAHREVDRLRKQGLLIAEMPAWVVKGERAYQRKRKARNRRALAARQAALAQEAA